MKIWMPSDQSLKMGCYTFISHPFVRVPRAPRMLAAGSRHMKAFRLRVLNPNMYMYSIILVIHPGILGDGRYIQLQVIQLSFSVRFAAVFKCFGPQDSCIFVQYPRCCKLLLALVAGDYGHAGATRGWRKSRH